MLPHGLLGILRRLVNTIARMIQPKGRPRDHDRQSRAVDPYESYLKDAARIPLLTPDEERVCAQNIEKFTRAFRRAIFGSDALLRYALGVQKAIVQGEASLHRVIETTRRPEGEAKERLKANVQTVQALLERNQDDMRALCSRRAFEAARALRPELTLEVFRQEIAKRVKRRREHATSLIEEVPIRLSSLMPHVSRYSALVRSMQADVAAAGGDRQAQKKLLYSFVMRTGLTPRGAEHNVSSIVRYEALRGVELNRMVSANQRLVVSVAKQFRSQGADVLDLIQAGSLGLMRAAELFRWRLGNKFSTYATWWIRQGIQNELHKLPARAESATARSIRSDVVKAREVLMHSLRREPSAEQITEYLNEHPKARKNYSLTDVCQALHFRQASLDEVISESGEMSLKDLIDGQPHQDPEDLSKIVDRGIERELLFRALSVLSEREQEILFQRFGFGGDEGQTLAEISDRLSISRERVRQIEGKALERLRTGKNREQLERILGSSRT